MFSLSIEDLIIKIYIYLIFISHNFVVLLCVICSIDDKLLKAMFLVSEPYTVREARIHVRHIRDLLKSVDNLDAYNGMDCNSLSFLNVVSSGNLGL